MDEPTKIEFEVDGQYENEKGIFTVVSIHRDEMVIRWANGEEIKTDIDLQRRIAERRQWEKQQRAAAAEAASKSPRKSSSAAKKPDFTGFAPADFKKSAKGTSWRSRYQLGTMVTNGIKSKQLTFNSWAFRYKPEMHVQDIRHHGRSAIEHQAKFFVRVDHKALYFGLKVGNPGQNNGESTDWNAFREWLEQTENEEVLRKTVARNNLTVSNQANPGAGILMASDDGWNSDANEQSAATDTIITYLEKTPASEPSDLEIAFSMEKDEAIADGKDIAGKIARLYTELLPLYQAAAVR